MPGSVYKVIEIIGTSAESWEDAARVAIEVAAKSVHGLRVAEVAQQDVTVEDGKVALYRTRLTLSFKYDQP